MFDAQTVKLLLRLVLVGVTRYQLDSDKAGLKELLRHVDEVREQIRAELRRCLH